MEYCIVSDNSGHDYVIPFEKKAEWREWCDIPENDERSWEEPEYAERIEGYRPVFKEYRLA